MFKLTFFLLLLTTLHVSASISAQTRQVTLEVQNATLEEVIQSLKSQTDYGFFYNIDGKEIQQVRNITISLKDVELEKALSTILKGTGLSFHVVNNVVIIKKQAPVMSRDTVKMQIVTGKVVDEKGLPIPGVNVIIKGTGVGSSTNIDGIYKIQARNRDTLVFSFVGCKRCCIPVAKKDSLILVKMVAETQGLEEVQIVAYGEQSKREVTGAIETLKADALKELPSHNVANLLQGKLAGVSVVNTSGSPGGGGTSVTIRGFNSLSIETERRLSEPLWVIDGIPVSNATSTTTGTNGLADLDPNFIESIEILKDAASASIYGSRAANGVILVTTKRGKEGRARLSLNYSESWSFNPVMPKVTGGAAERRFRSLQLKNFMQGYRYKAENGAYYYKNPVSYEEAYAQGGAYDAFWNAGKGADVPILQDSLNSFYNNSTNWFDEFVQIGRVRNVNVQASGGTKNCQYNIGLGYYDEKGILVGTDFTRVNLLGNYTMRPVKGALIDHRISVAYTNRAKGRGSYPGIELFDINPYKLSTLLPSVNSPVFEEAMQNLNGIDEKNYDFKLRNNFTLSYNILPNLKLSTSLGVDYWQNMMDYFRPSYLSSMKESYVSQMIGRSIMLLNENLLSYNTTWKKHKFDILLGQSTQYDQIDRTQGVAQGGASDFIHYAVGFPEYVIDVDPVTGEETYRPMQGFQSSSEKKALVSWFGRLNYVFNERYLFSFTLRRDGSSTFGENVRWGTFPSVSAGWIFSEEPLFENMPWLSFGKIRASYGRSGLHFSQPYLALGVYTADALEQFMQQTTLHPVWKDGLYNPELTWEETDQYDLGLELYFFQRRLNFIIDYYYRYTDGLLAPVSLPGAASYNPYQTQWRNAYAISNQGIEVKIEADFIRKENLIWEFTFNIARNWNRFEGSPDRRDFASTSSNINVVGKPLNQIYVYKQLGIYQNDSEVPTYDYVRDRYTYLLAGGVAQNVYRAGDPIYLDVNQDGIISSSDKVYGGSPLPQFSGGFTNNIRWKNFDLNFLFSFLLNRTVLNSSLGKSFQLTINDPADISVGSPILADLNDYDFWAPTNTNGDMPMVQADPGRAIFSNYSSRYIQNVSFMKLKSLVFGYNIPKPFENSNIGFRIFLSGENLWTITNYKGRDPEAIDLVTGIDGAETYPLSTRITLGFTVNF
ncbi:MAG: SusC/RagA family TonB-linked outer membrane protein [Marinifilaceae bacterium]|nr:SusC/RagA family TonB-linked outer membrane protein [Marinifilaceae bacterium]